MKKFLLLLLIIFIQYSAFSQTGGNRIFPYLKLSPSSRVSGLGGLVNAIKDDDVSLFVQNPALLSNGMNNKIALSYQPFSIGINNNFVAYSHTFGKDYSMGAALQFINYGKFTETNLVGDSIGRFFANDFAATVGISRPLNERISYGLNVKYLYSVLSSYKSSAIAMDFGGTYQDTALGLTVSLVLTNFGTQLNSYTPDNREKLPLDLQAGISKRLKHTPFLFSLGLHHLNQYDIRYNDTNAVAVSTITVDTSNGNTKPKKYIADKLARHVNLGVEIIIGKVLRFDIGYNHLRRKELAFDARKGMAGFNFGVQLHINRFNLGYAHSFYNIAGGYNVLSLGLDIDDFFGKKKM
jgi:hypothetical protein